MTNLNFHVCAEVEFTNFLALFGFSRETAERLPLCMLLGQPSYESLLRLSNTFCRLLQRIINTFCQIIAGGTGNLLTKTVLFAKVAKIFWHTALCIVKRSTASCWPVALTVLVTQYFIVGFPVNSSSCERIPLNNKKQRSKKKRQLVEWYQQNRFRKSLINARDKEYDACRL
jgi:hypothetical protein